MPKNTSYTKEEQALYDSVYENAFQEAMQKPMDYFSHDSNARRDPKLYSLEVKLGASARAHYWDLVEILHSEKGHALDIRDGLRWLAHELWISEDECNEFVHVLADLKLIEKEPFERGWVSMERVNENAEKYAVSTAAGVASAKVTNFKRGRA